MECQRVVVLVEESEAAKTALGWAIRNFIRGGDSITLLHVYPPTRSSKRKKSLRLKGFQLALSFKDLCNGIAEAKVEIVVREGDQAAMVVSLVNNIRASTLVVGLHDLSFLYKRANSSGFSANNLNCRILAVKQHRTTLHEFINAELSQVEIKTLFMSEHMYPFPIFSCPMWKRSRRRKTTKQP